MQQRDLVHEIVVNAAEPRRQRLRLEVSRGEFERLVGLVQVIRLDLLARLGGREAGFLARRVQSASAARSGKGSTAVAQAASAARIETSLHRPIHSIPQAEWAMNA